MATLEQGEELHRTIWAMADELRGAVGGWEFKAYVLGVAITKVLPPMLYKISLNLMNVTIPQRYGDILFFIS